MKKMILKGFITSKEQLRNSREGGPRVKLNILSEWEEGGEGAVIIREVTTATNSSAGYLLTCSMEYLKNREMEFEIHETRTGRLILDVIRSGYYNRG